MMKIVITALMSVTLAVAPDTIPATGGNITIQPINHATLELTYGGKVIDIDPVAQDTTQIVAPQAAASKAATDTSSRWAASGSTWRATRNASETKALKNIDVAFVPMNLPYTMPPSEAAECVKAFKPKIVYPYHYRGQNLDEFAKRAEGKRRRRPHPRLVLEVVSGFSRTDPRKSS
jgi:L-ascorbate metabolism protein UlaG (beta-lactamase superfamily)